MRARSLLQLAVVLSAASTSPALAQTTIAALAPGDTVRVRYEVPRLYSTGTAVRSGSAVRSLEARLSALRADTLVLHSDPTALAIPVSTLRRLEVRRGEERGSLGRGMLWGTLIGGLGGGMLLALGASALPDELLSGGELFAVGALTGVLVGAPVGAIVNVLRRRPVWEEVALPRDAR